MGDQTWNIIYYVPDQTYEPWIHSQMVLPLCPLTDSVVSYSSNNQNELFDIPSHYKRINKNNLEREKMFGTTVAFDVYCKYINFMF